jgi:hypothetical protein
LVKSNYSISLRYRSTSLSFNFFARADAVLK